MDILLFLDKSGGRTSATPTALTKAEELESRRDRASRSPREAERICVQESLVELLLHSTVTAIIEVVLGVIVLDKFFLSYWENKHRKESRQAVITSIAKRLDVIAEDWGHALNYIDAAGSSRMLDKTDDVMRAFSDDLRKKRDPLFEIAGIPPIPEVKQSPPVRETSGRDRLEKMLRNLLPHVSNQLRDVLLTIDAATVVMTPSMIEPLLTLRDAVLTNRRGISDLGQLLADPSVEQSSNLLSSAGHAMLSCSLYIELLSDIWKRIPKGDPVPLKFDFLPRIKSENEQMTLVSDYLRILIPGAA
jgi:hypothetical protein